MRNDDLQMLDPFDIMCGFGLCYHVCRVAWHVAVRAITQECRCQRQYDYWQDVIEYSQANPQRRTLFPASTALHMLRLLACYSGYTSGVEHEFNTLQRITANGLDHLFTMLVKLALACSSDTSDLADQTVVSVSRLIWAANVGGTR